MFELAAVPVAHIIVLRIQVEHSICDPLDSLDYLLVGSGAEVDSKCQLKKHKVLLRFARMTTWKLLLIDY